MAGSFVLLSRSISNQQRVSGGCGERLTVLSGNKFYQHWPRIGSPVLGSRIKRRAGNWNRCSLR